MAADKFPKSLRIGLLQTNIEWADKLSNLTHYSQSLAVAKWQALDIVFLPETFATGFTIQLVDTAEPEGEGQVLDWMKQQAIELNAVIAGSVLVQTDKKCVNRFYWVSPKGKVDWYDKRHLFRMANESVNVQAGDERKIFTLKGVRIMPAVCYDLRFPVWSRNQNDYDVMVNIANWPAARRRIWDTLLQARAIENQAYVIGVNRVGSDGNLVAHNGGTAVYDFVGDAIVSAPDDKETLLTADISLEALEHFRKRYPMHLDADQFELK